MMTTKRAVKTTYSTFESVNTLCQKAWILSEIKHALQEMCTVELGLKYFFNHIDTLSKELQKIEYVIQLTIRPCYHPMKTSAKVKLL